MIKVSVCISTYNLEAYIYQTLDSVLSQETSFDYEVIVGDDFSTDRTREILLRYKELYPDKIVLHFQENNVGVNRNDYDLIHLAKGEYIAWCDGDDYWLTKDKLQKQVDILDANPEFSCVHTHWIDCYEVNGRRRNIEIQQKAWERELKGDKYVERFVAGDTSGCRLSSLMYRKALVIDFLSKDSSLYLRVPHKQNDFALFCILSYYGPFYLLPEYTTAYRIRKESLSMCNSRLQRIDYVIAYLYLVIYLSQKFVIKKEVLHNTIRCKVALILYLMFDSMNIDWKDKLKELDSVVYKAYYCYSFGQRILIISLKNKIIYRFTKPLFDYLYTRSYVKNTPQLG